jgi:hypothetical protein
MHLLNKFWVMLINIKLSELILENLYNRAHVGGRFGQRSRLVKVDFAFSLVKSKVQVAL